MEYRSMVARGWGTEFEFKEAAQRNLGVVLLGTMVVNTWLSAFVTLIEVFNTPRVKSTVCRFKTKLLLYILEIDFAPSPLKSIIFKGLF